MEYKVPKPNFKLQAELFMSNNAGYPEASYDPFCMLYLAPESGTYEYLDKDGKTIKKFHHEGEVITVRVNKDDQNRND